MRLQQAANPAIVERITRLVYRSAVPGQVICILTALVLAAAYLSQVSLQFLAVWLAVTWALAGWRLHTAYGYLRAQQAGLVDYAAWSARFERGVNLTALIWGAGGYFFMQNGSDMHRLFTAFVLSGLVSGAVPILGAHYRALRNFAIIILLPILFSALIGKGPFDGVLAAMCLMYLVVVVKGVRHYNDAIVESIELELEQKQLVQQLEQARNSAEAASKAKTEFIANVSHEIRTPMNGIVGMAHVMEHSGLNPAQRQDLSVIQASAELLLALVNDVLDLSKIEAGQLDLSAKPFSLNTTLQRTVQMFAEVSREKHVDLQLQLPANTDVIVQGDQLRLQQVLVNLLGNAVKFTHQGQICVRVAQQGEQWCFEVSDTGIGIARDQLSQIFEAFVQADGSRARQYGGTGLGLTIARKLVSHLGGELQVESQLGQGTCFRFQIPLPVVSATPEVVADAPAKALPALKVLLAEDNPTNRLVATKLLQIAGHQVVQAENGQQAIEHVQRQDFDLVLMDVQMPLVDGLEATRQIRQLPRGAHLPIIALTANALEADRQACLAVGMNAFITKPVKPEVLQDTMHRVLQTTV
ncbi:ATP-binding protein [Chitinibacter tainanensis]|uniref:ATP-binding protein n=1 Tax=Chitinibacter tainanensis TaxID=230667 RepID=UPI002356D0F6|nr:ATP-binding protein [Chitinibacter tainanensis]